MLLVKLILKKGIDKISFYGKLFSNDEVLKAMMLGKKILRVFIFFTEWEKRAKRLSRNNGFCFLGVFCLYDHVFLVK